MAWSTAGLYVSSKGKVSLLRDTDGDGRADVEDVVASGWPGTDVGSGGVDATAVTLDREGNVYFGLLGADYSNAYRLRKRSDLRAEEVDWLKREGRWKEASGPDSAQDEFSLYDLKSPRGTIQRWDPQARKLETWATGLRVPVALAFNREGDLFNTDQEGETWMPNGNPLDELNHIVSGRNYGFPPRHTRWLPALVSESPVVAFGPQHQSACGLVFNEPVSKSDRTADPVVIPLPISAGQQVFGPEWWKGDAFVAGESRGKIWRVRLVKTPQGYIGKSYPIARLSMLTVDLAISPQGDLYVCCHSGPPDWGTGPQGEGKIFKITYADRKAPQPIAAWPSSPTEVRVIFDRPLDEKLAGAFERTGTNASSPGIEFGEYVTAGDGLETLKPPYEVVTQQEATPRGHLAIRSARLDDQRATLVLTTDPHPLSVPYVLRIPDSSSLGANGVQVEYDFHGIERLLFSQEVRGRLAVRSRLVGLPDAIANDPWLPWAPTNRASAGTDSRAARKPDGDWEHGRELFTSPKLNCVKCHRVRGEGGLAGPDLSNLIHRDPASVLRDIREPGATLHPDYVTYQAETRDGELHVGFLRDSSPDTVRLFDVDGRETALQRTNVANVHPTGVSLMPTGLLEGLSETDVRDLLTFLLHEPPTRARAEVEALIKKSGAVDDAAALPFRLVLVASKQDHGPGQHDYPAWQDKWMRLLSGIGSNTVAEKAWEWPSPAQWKAADVVVFYCWNHDWSAARFAELDAFQQRGGGLALIHSAVIADQEPERLAERIGLSAQPGRSGYRHMPFDLTWTQPGHPLLQGMPDRIAFLDEPYWPLIGDPARVHLLAVAEVDGGSQPLMWTFERGRGRVFVSVLGHYFWTLDDPLWRLVCLRGIAWAGRRELSALQEAAMREAFLK
jgi:putative heme-binding domain-containing protein